MAKKYDDSSISSLKGADRIRKRVGVMLGSNDIQGTQHAVFEIISNSIDEARSGYGDTINITIGNDNSIEVEDFGRGVPMDYNKAEDRYNWELIFCEMYSGSKYSNDSYDFSLGINGLGTFAAQASSEWFKVESRRDGKIFKMSFEKGEPVGNLIKEKDTAKPQKTGTKQIFKPDIEVFTDINIDKEWYLQMLKEQAIVNAGLTFNFIDKRDGTKETIVYPNGILGFAKELAGNETLTDAINFTFEGAGKDRADKPNYKVKGEVVILFGNKSPNSLYFHNSSPLLYGGSPRRAKEKALLEFFKTELKKTDSNRAKELEFEDIQDSMIFLSNTFSTETSYENQTKRAINNKFIEEFLAQQITKFLRDWAKENPLELEKVTNQVSINVQSRKSATAQKLATKQKLSNKMKLDDRIKNFVDCRNKNPEDRELFIAEGLSAMGSLKQARNGETQALLAIRGKILNTLKADYSSIFKNELIMDIMKLVGTGVEMHGGKGKNNLGNFDINNRRFDKIILATDQDTDGCFTGDTKIKSLDGNTYTFEELVNNNITELWVYSKDENGEVVPARAVNPRVTKETTELVELTFENGFVVRCTPDHRILLNDGTYKEAQSLTPNDSISSIYFRHSKIYNHRIKSMQHIVCDVPIKVYDLTVPGYENFMVCVDDDNLEGIIVHNCHIIALCLTLFYRLTPELIKQGYVYFLDTPLYEIQILEGKDKGKMLYAFTDQEMKDMTDGIKCKLSRNKGLGEVDYQTMAIFMSPETRHLTRVTMEDAKEAEKYLELFMGNDSADRKEYITLHGKEYTDLDLE